MLFFCPMIKSNAYGHGIELVVTALKNCKVNCVGVALVEEGVQLRQLGFTGQILVFGYFPVDSAEVLLEQKLTPVVSNYEDLENIKSMFIPNLNIKEIIIIDKDARQAQIKANPTIVDL